MSLARLTTESKNPLTTDIDLKSSLDILKCINIEDQLVAKVVETQLDAVRRIVDITVDRLQQGGRLIYLGCGTSGRLGVIDAVECSVTYGVPNGKVVGVIAGGAEALQKSIENLEDNEELGAEDLKRLNLNENDVVIGIAASGRTPYVIGGLRYANSIKSPTAAIVCNSESPMAELATIATVRLLVGPEVITGSTRMKAGTAQKMVLNMISTASMIKLGKCYGNLMVDLKADACYKLRDRAKRILSELADLTESESESVLQICNWELKTAILMTLKRLTDPDEARRQLRVAGGRLKHALPIGESESV